VHWVIGDLEFATDGKRVAELDGATTNGSNHVTEGVRSIGETPHALLRADATALLGAAADNATTVDHNANYMFDMIRQINGLNATNARRKVVKLLGKLNVNLAHDIGDGPVERRPKESVAALVLPKSSKVVHHAAVGIYISLTFVPKRVEKVRKRGHGLLILFEIELLKLLNMLKADIIHSSFPVGSRNQRAIAVGITGHVSAGRLAEIGQRIGQLIDRFGPLSALKLQPIGYIAGGYIDKPQELISVSFASYERCTVVYEPTSGKRLVMLFSFVNGNAGVDLDGVVGTESSQLLADKRLERLDVIGNLDLNDTKDLESSEANKVCSLVRKEDVAIRRIIRSPLGVHVRLIRRVSRKRDRSSVDASAERRRARSGMEAGTAFHNNSAAMDMSLKIGAFVNVYDRTDADRKISKADKSIRRIIMNTKLSVIIDHKRPIFARLVLSADKGDSAVNSASYKRTHSGVFKIRLTITLEIIGIHLFFLSARKSANAARSGHLSDNGILRSNIGRINDCALGSLGLSRSGLFRSNRGGKGRSFFGASKRNKILVLAIRRSDSLVGSGIDIASLGVYKVSISHN
jgi:hypothetical protein